MRKGMGWMFRELCRWEFVQTSDLTANINRHLFYFTFFMIVSQLIDLLRVTLT